MMKLFVQNGLMALLVLMSSGQVLVAQNLIKADSVVAVVKETPPQRSKKDSVKKEKSPASKAALRSAILPGWGQAYNKKYWKIPIVYTALAVPVYTFFYNKEWYDKTRYAYTVKVNNDTANYGNIDPELQPISTGSLRIYRDEFRQNMDFSVLAFLIIWGLQVADAAVDAHLKSFSVSDDLSFRIKPIYSPMTQTAGISLVIPIGR